MIRVLVAGYGVMTRGVVPHLARRADMTVSLLSRHQLTPPCEGVEIASPDDLADAPFDVVLGCFADDERSREFWTDPRVVGALSGLRTACIEMSTLSVDWAVEWHARIARAGGVSFESPVTGSRAGATDGTLAAFVHGSADDARAELVLGTFVRNRYDFAAPGNPARFKLVYNAWGASIMHSVAAYVPALQEALGQDFDVARQILGVEGWMAPVCASKLDRTVAQDYSDPDFALRHLVKDLRYAHDVLGDSNELLDLVYRSFRAAEDAYGGAADFTAVTGPAVRA
ncbi:NAD(P)-binding domain-containing protein [Kitasatospora sp. NPDC101801]|uniref:NAD(P)-binding domain-containing protein n=1 Tax=Kitasatospora sp. NPDC101801 TaxID=3364103 RepID=UPI003807C0C1